VVSRRVAPRGRLLVDGRPVGPVEVASTNALKRKGLLGRGHLDGGFVLDRCHQVHTFRMRFAIDVAHLDRRGRVLTVRSMPPGRLGPLVLRGRSVLEAAAGAFDDWGLGRGSVVTWELG
jgi:uncharacterized protein